MPGIERRNAAFHVGFYCAGGVMTLVCLVFILGGNTELLYQSEHTGFPLSWAFAGLAILAFLAAEFFGSTDSAVSEAQEENSDIPQQWETIGA